MKRALWFVAGMGFCAYKGVKYLIYWLRPGWQSDKEEHFVDSFGWSDPALESEWARLENRVEPFGHVSTNIVVEWTRLGPQRAAKFFCALWLVSVAVALLWG